MSTLQNIIILTISFLLSRVFIDSDIHKQFLDPEWSKTTNVNTSIVSAVLFASYCLSLVFSNTIVVLSFIPIIRHILSKIKDSQIKRFFSTQLILALIYGANIGGMGSLTGSPQNLIFIGSVEILKVPGRGNINYFTWLIIGIPATLGLLFISRLILKIGETKYLHEQPLQFWQKTIKKVKVRKHLYFIGGNILLIIILTALQFLTKPQPLYSGLNIIDIIFIFYFLVFIFTNLIYPREERTFKSGLKNFVFMFLFVILFPFIFICEAIREIGARLQMNNLKIVCTMESTVHSIYSRLWFFLFKEKTDDLRMKNKNVYVSINRMIYDLPFFGIILMGMITLFAIIIIKIGDNPETAKLDGYLVNCFDRLSLQLIPHRDQIFIYLLALIFISIFFTEIINNTTVLLVILPLVYKISIAIPNNPLFFMLAATIATSGAFMTPIATSVNAVAFAGVRGVSLKRMLKLGFFMNITSGLWFAILFFLFNKLFM